jgi:CRP/FNR family transcriptional regulator, cyclic AMP receptor protein
VPAALQKVPIFAGLNEAALNLLWDRAKEIKASAGEVVVREGETGNRLFLVGEGQVRVCKNFGKPDEVELAILGPSNFFGEMCILETLPRSATVQAVTDTTLYSLTSLAFYHLYEAVPSQHSILVLNIARDVSRRLRHLDEVFAARH